MALFPPTAPQQADAMWIRSSSTQEAPGEWSDRSGKVRVLVEDPDGAERWALQALLERHGYEVAVCGGPETLRGGRCPLVSEGFCPAAAGADAVFNHLRLSEPQSRAVLEGLRRELRRTPVVVEVPQPKAGAVPPGCFVAPAPVRSGEALAAIAAALSRPIPD